MSFFWNGRRITCRIALKISRIIVNLLGSFRQKMTGSCHVKELWHHKRNSLRPIFQGNRVFSDVTCCHWQKWRYYARCRSAHDHIWHLTLHLDRSKVIRGHLPWLTPCLLVMANLAVLGFYEALRPNTRLIFHIDMFIVPLYTIRRQSAQLTQLCSVQNSTKDSLLKVIFRYHS